MALNTKTRQELKAKAHHLKPVVLLGHQGLTDAVLKEIDVALLAHELIKVKYASLDRAEREKVFATIAASLKAECIQMIGNIVVIYRKKES